MTVINTNVAASLTANAMKHNQRAMESTMERLATGFRINSASDDAAGLAIGTRMDAQIRGLNQAVRNANDGISLLQTVDGAAAEMTNMFQRMRELAVQSETGTNSASDISNLNQEFAALAAEIDRLADDTTFNGINVMKAGQTMTFAIGADEADTVSVALNDFNLANGGATAGEVVAQNTSGLVAALADLKTDLASGGSISIDDGDTTISIDLTDIIETANDESLLSSSVDQAQIAAALDAKAVANENFSARITATGSTGFTVTEKAGQANSTDTYSLQTELQTVTNDSFTMAAGTSGTSNGVLGANLSEFSDTTSSSVDGPGTIAAIDTALDGLSSARGTIGSAVARLEFTVDSLSNASLNNSAAKSRVMDADYAAETTELARSQIIAQASTAMLSQANQQAQSVLALLK